MSFNGNADEGPGPDLYRLRPLVEADNSSVYEMVSSKKGRSLVLKILPPTEINRKMHCVETEVYKLLQTSPRKITPDLVHSGTNNKGPYIILEKAKTDLLYLVMDPGPEVVFCKKCVLRSVVRVVMDLHAALVAHMDIKPENFLISHSGEIWLCDFGCSVICKSHKGTYSGNVGTHFYSAPEVNLSKRYNPFLADIWSVTMLFYVMLTKVFPYTQAESDLLKQQIDVISRKNFGAHLETANVSASDKAFLKRVIIKRPEDRKSLAEILQDAWFDCDDFHPIEFNNSKKRRCLLS